MDTTKHWLKRGAVSLALVVVAGGGLGLMQRVAPTPAPAPAPAPVTRPGRSALAPLTPAERARMADEVAAEVGAELWDDLKARDPALVEGIPRPVAPAPR